MAKYDEQRIVADLASRTPAERIAFAAACAETLWPLYEWASTAGNAPGLRAHLDLAWSAAGSAVPDDSLARAAGEAVDLVPSDDEWSELSPLSENGAASVAHALETARSGDASDACMSARQLYEAADFLVQRGAALHTYVDPIDAEPPVALALSSIATDLSDLRALDDLDDRGEPLTANWLSQLRTRAAADGRRLLDIAIGDNPDELLDS
jgi:hypothetical protein